MTGYTFRKILVVLIIALPVFSWTGCKKQVKCGCGKDVLFSLTKELYDRSSIVFSSENYASFTTGYDTYIFCNPAQMYAKYNSLSGDDQILISGDVYWDCTYMMNSSNSYYYQYYKIYNIQVTEMESYLYGKK